LSSSSFEASKAAALRKETLESCTLPLSSPDRASWEQGWHSTSPEPLPAERADAPFVESKGLTAAELNDVIGADDYEAGADAPAAREA
jgi:hypothetical protein